jgi:hypothetical protein
MIAQTFFGGLETAAPWIYRDIWISSLVRHPSFVIRASSLCDRMEPEQDHEQEQDYERNNSPGRLTQTPLQR